MRSLQGQKIYPQLESIELFIRKGERRQFWKVDYLRWEPTRPWNVHVEDCPTSSMSAIPYRLERFKYSLIAPYSKDNHKVNSVLLI